MARTITAPKRLTNRYIDSYKHLDQWDYDNAIVFKELKRKYLDAWSVYLRDKRSDEPDVSEVGETTLKLVLKSPKDANDTDVRQALYEEYSAGGCTHEYDCCGCHFTSASLTKVGKREWRVVLNHGRNY